MPVPAVRAALTDGRVVTLTSHRLLNGVVETEEYRVNGPGCDPVTANATLQLDDPGVVTVRIP